MIPFKEMETGDQIQEDGGRKLHHLRFFMQKMLLQT